LEGCCVGDVTGDEALPLPFSFECDLDFFFGEEVGDVVGSSSSSKLWHSLDFLRDFFFFLFLSNSSRSSSFFDLELSCFGTFRFLPLPNS
jgi:hypothetical protein